MIVLDCSAAINMLVETPEGKGLAALLLEGEAVISPTFFCAEVTHVLEKRVRGGYSDKKEALAMGCMCFALVDEFVPDASLWEEVLSESLRLEHPSYDLFYFVLARRRGATLFTLDRRLQELCLDNGVDCMVADMKF